jgi:riboflavin biosynthesis pyrimidine reductase
MGRRPRWRRRGRPRATDKWRSPAAALNQYLSRGAVDELRLHVVPITLGAGERVFDGVGGLTLDIDRVRPTQQVVHVTLRLPAR